MAKNGGETADETAPLESAAPPQKASLPPEEPIGVPEPAPPGARAGAPPKKAPEPPRSVAAAAPEETEPAPVPADETAAKRRKIRFQFPGRKPPSLFPDDGDTRGGTTVDLEEQRERREKRPGRPPIPYDFDREEMASAEAGILFATRKSRLFLLFSLAALLCAGVSVWLTMAPAYSLWLPGNFSYLKTPYLYLAALLACQLFSMLCAVDIMAAGLWRLAKLRPTLDSLIAAMSLAAFVHGICIVAFPKWGGYLPYCALSCVSLFFALTAKRQQYAALRRQLKALTISATPMGVFTEEEPDGSVRAHKIRAEVTPETLARMRENTPTEEYSALYAPLALTACFVFALLSSAGRGAPARFPWAFSALLSAALPFNILLSSSLPMQKTARRLFASGAVLIGADSGKRMKRCRQAVLCDEDLFPAGTIGMGGLKVIGSDSFERVLAYTASAVNAADIGIKRVFNDLLQQQFVKMVKVEKLRHYESGGISAEIGGDVVLVGTSGFLLRMGVRVREGLNIKNGVFTAINSELAGIFALKYTVNPGVAEAFDIFRRSRITPVLAARDFNLTPGLVESRLKLKRGKGKLAYPDIAKRLDLSHPERFFPDPPEAFLARDGAAAFAETLSAAKKLRKIIRANVTFSTCAAALGLLLMFYLTYGASFSAAAPHNLLFYHLLWLIPVFLSSFRAGRY